MNVQCFDDMVIFVLCRQYLYNNLRSLWVPILPPTQLPIPGLQQASRILRQSGEADVHMWSSPNVQLLTVESECLKCAGYRHTPEEDIVTERLNVPLTGRLFGH